MATMNAPTPTLHTPGFAHYSLAWSPFIANRLAIASSANYGLIGNGRLHITSVGPPPQAVAAPAPSSAPSLAIDKFFPTQDGLFDVAWSEVHENQLVSSSGDGSIRLWDVTLNDLPIRIWTEHTKEVFSVDWSNVRKDTFSSSSWDGTVKIWTPEVQHSVSTIHAHTSCVYQALFSPHHADLIASCSADGTLKVFDLRSPAFLPSAGAAPSNAPALTVPVCVGAEVLSLDWNKYRPLVLASAGTDKRVRIWDCRMMKTGVGAQGAVESVGGAVGGVCEADLLGHEYAVRKVQWSPHRPDVLASASYDMTCRVWTTNPAMGQPQLMRIQDAHTEFVAGCAWSLFDEGLLASCGWDARVNLFRV